MQPHAATRTRPTSTPKSTSGRLAPPGQGLRVVYAPDPRRYYPTAMVRRGIEGTVTLGFVVSAQGEVERAWVENTSGIDALDRAALALMHAYRFAAPGSPRRSRMPVTFRIASPVARPGRSSR